MKAYTYLIKHKPTGKTYYGFRSANKVEPQEDLWQQYFTSSPGVQQPIEEEVYAWEILLSKKEKILLTAEDLQANTDRMNEMIDDE